jgi:hypothetical protein
MSKNHSWLGAAVFMAWMGLVCWVGMKIPDANAQLQQGGMLTASYGRGGTVPTNAPYYVGPGPYTVAVQIPAATLATNAVPANKTNGTLFSFPIDKRTYRFFSIEVMCNQISNQTASVGMFTNYLSLYASGDEGRYNSNTPAWTSGPMTPQTGSTNLYYITNVPAGIFDNVGYLFATFGNQGTNTVTNILVRPFVTPLSVN